MSIPSFLPPGFDPSGELLSSLGVDLSSPGPVLLPGLCDVHVHFREPGFEYKETVASGFAAAAHGGVTTAFPMPNLSPVPDSREHLDAVLSRIPPHLRSHVLPYGALTVGEKGEQPADLAAMAPYVVAFSDDGKGVQDKEMMRSLMLECKRLGKVLAAHCEDNSLLFGGYIHDGNYAKRHGHKGICSESEWHPIARDLELCAETGCAYHVCHISTKESVSLIRDAKKSGVNVTCETAPHYLVLTSDDLQEDGRFKMNPPLRDKADRDALIEGVLDGTVDMIATDHAPHSAEEKSRGLAGSSFGVVGIETSFSAMYTYFVKPGILSLSRLVELMSENPRTRFSVPYDGSFAVWDLERSYTVDPQRFLSKGKATPFEGHTLCGVNLLTYADGNVVYRLQA